MIVYKNAFYLQQQLIIDVILSILFLLLYLFYYTNTAKKLCQANHSNLL